MVRGSGRTESGLRRRSRGTGEVVGEEGRDATSAGSSVLAIAEIWFSLDSGSDSGVLGDIAVDPVQVIGDPSVDARPVGLCTALTPADHTCLQPVVLDPADQRSSGVALERRGVSTLVKARWSCQDDEGTGAHLAGVVSFIPSTQHVVTDNVDVVPRVETFVILQVTKVVFHNGNLHLFQGKWWWQAFCG